VGSRTSGLPIIEKSNIEGERKGENRISISITHTVEWKLARRLFRSKRNKKTTLLASANFICKKKENIQLDFSFLRILLD